MEKRHPADVAEALRNMPFDEAVRQLALLSPDTASDVLAELDDERAARLLGGLPPPVAASFFRRLPANEAADIAAELSAAGRHTALASLTDAAHRRVNAILRYPEQSVGAIMRDSFLAFPAHMTIGECLASLQQHEEDEFQRAAYLYVTDADGRLSGVVQVRDLVFRHHDRPLGAIMRVDVKCVQTTDDQEAVARLFTKYHFLALPVLDRDGRLAGVVDADRILHVIQQEATEDMQKMVGISGEEHADTPWRSAIRQRLPWLLVNLATAFLAGWVVSLFEGTISRWTALVAFLPIIAGQGGNSGMQTLTVIVRGLALDELPRERAVPAIRKEITLGLLNGVAVGLISGLVGYLWQGSLLLGLVVTGGMFLNIVAAALSGILIPLGLRRVGVDPALASSILLTTVTDVFGFLAFLGLAFFVLWL